MNIFKKVNTFLLSFLSIISIYSQYSYNEIPENLISNSNAVIRKDDVHFTINSQNSISIKTHKAVTILNKSGESEAFLYVNYNKQRKVKSISGTVYDKAGNKIKNITKKDFNDFYAAASFSLYEEDRVLFYAPTWNNYPYTVEFKYELENGNTIFIPDFIPIDSYNVSIQKASYTFDNKTNIELRTKNYSENLFPIKSEKRGSLLIYSAENIPAIEEEYLSPSLSDIAPKTRFSLEKFNLVDKMGSFTDWNNWGLWYYENILKERDNLSSKEKDELNKLVENLPKTEKIKKLYQYMQDKTRYINVSIGIGGWQPSFSSEVHSKGYGDCKALSNYMKSILNAVGIESYYAVINSGNSPVLFDENFPRMGGNHAILCVPNEKDTIWLENTNQKIAFNFIGNSNANRNALLITPKGGKIVKTPSFKTKDNNESLFLDMNILPNGDATLNVDFTFTGAEYGDKYWIAHEEIKKQKDFVKSYSSERNLNEINNLSITNDRDNAILKYKYNSSISNYTKKIGNEIIVDLVPFSNTKKILKEDPNRKMPLEISYPYEENYTIYISIPKDHKIVNIPPIQKFSSKFGEYILETSIENDNKLKVSRILTINSGIFPKEEYNDYVKFYNLIKKSDNSKALITKKL